MNETEKLLRKRTKKERDELLALIDALDIPEALSQLHPEKLRGSDLYRVRKGKFRIIFHFANGKAVTDSFRMRNEKTYRDV